MSRAKKRADRIRAEVRIEQVLSDYGYAVRADGGGREQQYSCDLHGSGRDMSPSARVYPGTNSSYCFGCGRSRDALQFAREKEGLDFWGAVKALEERYHLPPLPWEDEDSERAVEDVSVQVKESLQAGVSFEDLRQRAQRRLELVTADREVPLNRILTLWEAFDRVCFGVDEEEWGEGKGCVKLSQIIDEAMPK